MSYIHPSRNRSRTPSRANLTNHDMQISTPIAAKITNRGGFKSWLKSPDAAHSRFCFEVPIIHPFGPFRLSWDFLVIIVLLYTSIEVPCSVHLYALSDMQVQHALC